MKNKIVSLKTGWLIFLTALFVVSLSSCAVVQPRYKVRHDNGLRKGWYKKRDKANSSHYKYHQKGPKSKKAKGSK